MPRFALSLHTGGPGGRHYDLLLERGPVLRTWRIRRPDFRRPQIALPLPDHRRIYLRYEGPVSGGRGRVRRRDAGIFFPDVERPGLLLAGFSGRRIRTRLLLRARADGSWTLADPTLPLRRLAGPLRRTLRTAADLPPRLLRPARHLLELADRCLQGRPVDPRSIETASRPLRRSSPRPLPRLRRLAAALLRLLRPPS